MNPKKAVFALILIVVALTTASRLGSYQEVARKRVVDYLVNEKTAVRFCDTDEEEYFHVPLIFRAVKTGDGRLNTAPIISREGRTAFVTVEELRQLVQSLARSSLSWHDSNEVESLKWKPPLDCFDGMDILVVCLNGSANSKIPPNKICETLQALDPTLQTPRALWEFQLFRHGYGCKVPGFNFQAYPDHSH
jgi:hypothetical protein